MKRGIKIFLISALSIIIIFLGLAFYAYQKFSPEEIKKMTVTALDAQFQNAKSEVGDVTLDFGFIFKVSFKGIKLKTEKGDIFSIKEVSTKIPFYSVLFGAGAVDLNLDSVKINYLENEKGSNFEMRKGESRESSSKSFVFLANVKVNVKMIDLHISYSLKTGKKGEVFLSEVNFFNLNFLDKTKFNAKSLLKGDGYSLNANGEGELDLSKLWTEKMILGSASLICEDFKVKMIPGKIPPIRTNLTFSYDSQGRIRSEIQSFIEKEMVFDSKLIYFEGTSVYDPMKLNLPLDKILTEYGPLGFKGNKIEAKGKFSMNEKEMNPQIEFVWDKGPSLKGQNSSSKIKGKLNKDFLDVNILANVYDGSVKMGISGKINYANPKKMGPFKIDLLLKDFKYKAPAEEKKAVKEGRGASKETKDQMVLIPATVNLSFENISLMDNKTSGSGILILAENSLKIPKMEIRVGKGKVKISSMIRLQKEKKVGDLDLSFDDIDLKILNPYFPKGVGAITGILFGSFKGNFDQGPNGLVISNGQFGLKAKDGKIKEFNLEKHILKVFDSLSILSPYKDKDLGSWVTGDFQTLELNGKMDNEQLNLDKIYFLGINHKIEIKGKGEINKTKSSQVLIDFIDHSGKISGPIKKLTGTGDLNFKFIGTGYDLKPDYGYTLGVIGKKALPIKMENEGKKLLEKFLKKL